MRDALLNTWVLTAVAVAVLALSVIASATSGHWHWFGRAGSVTTVVGLLLMVKHAILAASRDRHDVVMEKNHFANFAPERDSPEYRLAEQNASRVLRDEKLGLIFTLIGTVVWGYGDLL